MNFNQTIKRVFINRKGLTLFGTIFLTSWLVLFIFSEWSFLRGLVESHVAANIFWPLMPKLFYSFVFSNDILAIHHLIISLLLSSYLTLILHIFVKKKYFSFKSFSFGMLGLVGVSIGLTCISCSAVIGLLLLSFFGAAVFPLFIIHYSGYFIWIGEFALLFSNVLALLAVRKFG